MLIINFLSTPNVSWSGYAPGCIGCWCRIDGRKSAWRYRKLVCQHDNIYKYNILAMKTMKIVTWISNVVTHGRYLQDQRIPPKGPRDVYFIFSSLSLSLSRSPPPATTLPGPSAKRTRLVNGRGPYPSSRPQPAVSPARTHPTYPRSNTHARAHAPPPCARRRRPFRRAHSGPVVY